MKYPIPISEKSFRNLRADCENCFGLCCVALYFSASEGFPIDKDAGQPCVNLQPDFRCCIHKGLMEQGLKGCVAFDCFGSGQKVSQVSFAGHDWRKVPESARQMFDVFLIMRQIHELLWYLTEALTLHPARPIYSALSTMLDETERLTHLSPDSLMELDVVVHRAKVNTLLLKTSELVRAEARRGQKPTSGRRKAIGRGADLIAADLRRIDLRGANLRGADLIAADLRRIDLRGANLRGADLIVADLRRIDLRGANLRGADLIAADLRRIDLRGANLRGAYLIAADLRGADLSGADLIGADFRDADIRGADLTESIFLTQAQLNAAKGDMSTKFPTSLTRPMQWDS